MTPLLGDTDTTVRAWDWTPGAVIPRTDLVRVARRWIPEGDRGVYVTLGVMRDIIVQSAVDPDVRRAAVEATAYFSHADRASEIDAVAAWILARVDYRPDPLLSEWLQTPPSVVQAIARGERPALDCDDLTMLSLSMLQAIGIAGDLEVVATQPDSVFDHVRGLVEHDGAWDILDLTAVGAPDFAPEYRSEVFPVTA
jgi:transglutaminase-like putative cysteine protease